MIDDRIQASPVLNTINDVIARTGISRSKIYEKMATGALEAVKVDGRTYVTEAGLQAYIASLPRVTSCSQKAA